MSQIEFDLFQTQANKPNEDNHKTLTSQQQNIIFGLLENGKTSALEISEYIIEKNQASGQRFSSGKPKIYPYVCLYLDSLVSKGQLELIEKIEQNDRLYKLII